MSSIYVLSKNLKLLDSLEQLFLRARFEVSIFDQPGVMLEQLKSECPDCVLIEAPDKKSNTLKLLNHVRNSKPNAPVIILGSNDNMSGAVGAIRAGAKDYIETPIIDRLLIESVQNAISDN